MSKRVKNMIADEIKRRLEGVDEALLVNVIGLDVNSTVTLRRELREKNIELMVVKNGQARRATAGTPLAPAFEGVEGSAAIIWGSEDIISLAKEVVRLDKDTDSYEEFKARGGVMDGEALSAERVIEIAKWPNRDEMLSILSGQILSPGAELCGALLGPGGGLASQVEKIAEGETGAAADSEG